MEKTVGRESEVQPGRNDRSVLKGAISIPVLNGSFVIALVEFQIYLL